jgi:hypothetical protein
LKNKFTPSSFCGLDSIHSSRMRGESAGPHSPMLGGRRQFACNMLFIDRYSNFCRGNRPPRAALSHPPCPPPVTIRRFCDNETIAIR